MNSKAARLLTASWAAARAAALPLLLPLILGGCITVFPQPTPAQMYNFGDQVPAPATAAPPATAPVAVSRGAVSFPSAASGDRILTVTGAESAFIAGARWVQPAESLFEQAVVRAFDTPGSPRLVARGEPLPAPSTLRLDVRTFEARYPGPVVHMQVRATLIRNADRTLVGERMFDAQVPAADNRQGAIVSAFGQAVGQVVTQLRDWTAATAPAAAPPAAR